ncbi:iron uptake porin [Microcoleus sp. FACHB-SPT15]|uniref:iron uptake porin n=1 Tax=Microcoleus sp. FACHB-SPT15 TaxID=2692830 RepID=UPI0028C42722|nr:iron uptake porin [Microcoleus sp. FACHB-SPT15]
MKSCPDYQKAASSALIFATLSCFAATISSAQAAPEINSTAVTSAEASTQEFPASTGLSTAEVAPATNQPTVAELTNPVTELELAPNLVSEEVRSQSEQEGQGEILNFPSSVSPQQVATDNTPVQATETLPRPVETNVKDLAQALPTQGDTSKDTVGQLAKGVTPPQTPPRSGEGLSDSSFPSREGGWGVRFSEFANGISEPITPAAGQLDSLDPMQADDPMGQVTNVTQLSDVSPGEWAYEALRNLVERYGCIAGYPDGTFRGNRALTRYEFAAGLNSCLQQVERLLTASSEGFVVREDLETLQRLVREFETELANLGTRVDELEGRTAALEDNQFSTTTKLFGQAIFGVQGRSENEFDFFLDRFEDDSTNVNVIDNVQLSLFTQFSPRSLLLTGLQAGEGSGTGVFLENYVGLGYEGDNNNDFELSDLNYRQLFGNNFALIVGPVGVNPVNVFRGVNRVESAGAGPLSRFAQRNPIISIGGNGGGVGFDWQLGTRFSLQGIYSANRTNDSINGGLFGGDEGTTTAGAQLVISPTNTIDISLQYINSYSPSGQLGTGVGDDILAIQIPNANGFLRAPMLTNAFGATLEWRLTPGFTAGGWGGYTTSDFTGGDGNVETFNWMAFLNFPDLLGEGNLAGIYVGQPPKITSSDISDDNGGRNIPSFVNRGDFTFSEGGQPDTTTHVEGFFRFQVTDNISITPGVIVIFNPNHNDNNDTITIGAIRTTFNF